MSRMTEEELEDSLNALARFERDWYVCYRQHKRKQIGYAMPSDPSRTEVIRAHISALTEENERLREELSDSREVLRDMPLDMWSKAQAYQYMADEDDEKAMEIRGWFKRREAALSAPKE